VLIQVADIPPEGLRIEGTEEFPRPFQDAGWHLEGVALTVEKEGDTVFVRGELTARVPLTCGRCVEPYTVTVHPTVDARFVPSPATRGEERELGADDLETDVYQNGVLDLTALLETETTLALPMKPLCRETCRGLCPVCGGNRNVTACACEPRTPDPRWAALKDWAGRTR
jgi:DUF177 domain-containing protein